MCPYHGWAFDGQGVLRDVPAAENKGEWPVKQLVDVYPVVEKVTHCTWLDLKTIHESESCNFFCVL